VASVGIEDEDGTVFAADLDRLAGVGALVEQVETRFLLVVWNPFADGREAGGRLKAEGWRIQFLRKARRSPFKTLAVSVATGRSFVCTPVPRNPSR
jgi:hypothetical protein